MPYFRSANLLFIHIPKTGGSSIEKYFSRKYATPLNHRSLFMGLPENIKVSDQYDRSISLQHQPYTSILKHKNVFGLQIDAQTKIITSVRNPYTRIISDLFYYKYINPNSTPEEVNEVMRRHVNNKHDNHQTPQYKFVIDENGALVKNLIVLRTEHLVEDMRKNGYTDFNIYENVGANSKLNYMDYLNKDSIKLINEVYDKDFFFFGYQKINL